MANMVPFNKKNRGILNSSDFYNTIDNFFSEPWFMDRYGSDTFRVDVQQNDNEYLVEAELPGVKREEVELSMNEGSLQIAVNREENVNDEGKGYIHRERRFSSMSRNVYLGDSASDGIKAKLDNGILKISVPRQKKADNSRKIEIE